MGGCRLAPMTTSEEATCALRVAAEGVAEPCPRGRCPFWEPGGAVVAGGCVIDRLGVEVRRPDLAGYLLETRRRLEEARTRKELEAAHRLFSRRIGLRILNSARRLEA